MWSEINNFSLITYIPYLCLWYHGYDSKTKESISYFIIASKVNKF
jgi:hypothetical protein